MQLLVNGSSLPERSIDEVKKVGIGIAGVEIHQLGSVDNRSTAYSEESIWLIWFGKSNSFFYPCGSQQA